MVNEADYQRLMRYAWSYEHGYGRRTEAGKSYYLHREVLGAPSDQLVDHINGDKLDNRRENLRLCSTSQNAMNSETRSDNTSGFRGVYFNSQRNRWQAYIQVDGRRKHYGFYQDIEEAVSARLFAEYEHFGEFARI